MKLNTKMKVNEVSTNVWEIPASEKKGMNVPARVYATQSLLEHMDSGVFEQVTNVACLPGIVKHAIALPDAHSGYGFPVGGVAAFDKETGIISPGGIGFDINCGIRLMRTNLTEKEVRPKIKELMDQLFRDVPSGVGVKGEMRLGKKELIEVMENGAEWCLENGYAWKEDVERIEEKGRIKGARHEDVSDKAMGRAMSQMGTLGSGNHFLEVQTVPKEAVFDEETAKAFGFMEEGQVMVMIHCGSRGFGHQVATDYLREFGPAMEKYGLSVKDKELACAPFGSDEGQRYYSAMACAANSAFANRQVIMHHTRKAFERVFKKTSEEMEMGLVYDIAHNIAKLEKYKVNGKMKELVVHRKGATRGFGPDNEALPKYYRKTGQPVIVGGSMETGSYVCAGTKKAEEETFGSAMHGSGRTMSRHEAKKHVKGEDVKRHMLEEGIYVRSASYSGLAEEAGIAYKDISEVVRTLDEIGVCRKVFALKPMGNVKG